MDPPYHTVFFGGDGPASEPAVAVFRAEGSASHPAVPISRAEGPPQQSEARKGWYQDQQSEARKGWYQDQHKNPSWG